MTMLLNQGIPYQDAATEESTGFFQQESTPLLELLHTGTRLCCFAPITSAARTQRSWWVLFDPHKLSNLTLVPGIGDFLFHSGCRIDHNRHLHQPSGVKVCCAEARSQFLMVSLVRPVYAYIGLTRKWRPEPLGGTLPLPGGEYRVWTPGLTSLDVQRIALPMPLLFVPPRQVEEKPEAATDGSGSDEVTSTASGTASDLTRVDED